MAADTASTVLLGDLTVHRLGLGTNRITDTEAARDLLLRAVALGVNFIDTANVYRNGESERTIGQTLSPYPPGLVIATKGGMHGASPEQLKDDLAASLERLQTDRIDLYQLHRVDPSIPLETSVRTLKQFMDEGRVRHIGLSEVTIEQIELARSIVPIVSVQNEYNLASRQYEAVVDYCTEQGIVFIPWFPLGGLGGDTARVNQIAAELAWKYDALPQQIALAWLLKRSSLMLPIPGTLSIEHLESNLAAAELALHDADFGSLMTAAT